MATQFAPRKIRQPRLAEVVARALRDRILSGDLSDGDLLPKQEELMIEFGVSAPCIREAFRILETEGLATVLRGNVGGAKVHPPQPANAAYMMGLVLQSQKVTVADLMDAMCTLEPVCAAACAARPDRATTVLPVLRDILDRGLAAVDDSSTFIALAREFHTAIVANCGNATMGLIVGSLERLWSAQVRTISDYGAFEDRAVRLQQALGHEQIYRLISEGDAEAVRRAVEQHFGGPNPENRHNMDIDAIIVADPAT